MKQDMIVILDLGSEENPRLAREIRALGVYSEIYPHDITLAELNALPNVKGIILNGGPNHVVDGVEIDACSDIYGCGLPLLQPGHKGGAPWPTDAAQRKAVLSEFVFDACGAQPNWNMENFIADQVELIRRQVGDKKVLLALSGGVDSSVVAALLIKAIGKQLVCVHVNHGLLRKGEPEQVVEVFRNQMDANLIYVDAVDRFLNKLSGVAEPEQKRKIIGDFIFGISFMFLGLGTLRQTGIDMDLAHNQPVLEFFASFDPHSFQTTITFLIIGSILTMCVQSSAAVMAITMILCSTGVLPIYQGIALVMGENIGTTVTSNVAALTANTQARRAAMAHMVFNIFGVLWILCIFHPFIHLVCGWVGFDDAMEKTDPHFVANATKLSFVLAAFHTTFNLPNSFILVWFIPQI